ncbi:MAG: calcium-binding protein [Paracoccaceae bacterium]
MNISYIGTETGFFDIGSVFLPSLFFPSPAPFISQSVSFNTVELQSSGSLHSLVLQGTGFTADANGNLNGGTITSVSIGEPFASPFEPIVTFSEINWTVLEFLTASQTAYDFEDFADLSALLNAQGPVTFDASEAIAVVEPSQILDLITEDINFIGSAFSDTVTGGDGNDTINPGSNSDSADLLTASLGNDTYDFGLSDAQTFSVVIYKDFNGIDAVVDGSTGTGSIAVASAGFTDTLINVDQALAWAFGIDGSNGNDSYDITLGGASFPPDETIGVPGSQRLNLRSGEGTDSFDIHFDGGGYLSFQMATGFSLTAPTQGFVADISNGTITNDGHGNSESISVTGTGGTLAFTLTDFADSVIGNDMNNVFVTNLGDDTIDGGDGFDVVLYSSSGIGSGLTVDLSTGVASGTWNGSAFTDSLTNIEGVRGSRDEADLLIGAAADESFWGRGGNDSIAGGLGNDTLNGEADDDLLEGGRGNDIIDGGDGIDTATYENASAGVTVKLAKGEAFGGDNFDLLTDIENLIGSDHDDKLVSDLGANVIDSGDGDDIVRSLGGNDTINSGFGDDEVFGVGDAETIDLGDGNDVARTKGGNDFVDTGDGDDRALTGGGDDIAIGREGQDEFFMGSGNDTAFGGFGEDTLNGGSNADVLDGGPGDDRVRGDDGVDHLNGNSGNDLLNGGANADTFWFFDIHSMGRDRITDFEDGLDVINLSDWGFASAADVLALASSAGGFDQHTRITFTDGVNDQKRDIVIENLDLADFDASDITLTGVNPFDIVI